MFEKYRKRANEDIEKNLPRLFHITKPSENCLCSEDKELLQKKN